MRSIVSTAITRTQARTLLAHGHAMKVLALNPQFKRWNSTKTDEVEYSTINRWEGSWHWYGERALSVALVPMLGISMFYGGHPANDFLLGFVVPIHTHIGLSAVVTDYLPARRVPILNKIVTGVQILLTGGAIYGCYKINTEDVGLTEYFKKLWFSKTIEKSD